MSCQPGCYEARINTCADIVLKAGLTANTAYYVIISKPGNTNVYQRRIVSEADNSLVIRTESYPLGYFTPGHFTLQIKNEAFTAVVPMTFNAVAYNCATIEIVSTDIEEGDTANTSTIQ